MATTCCDKTCAILFFQTAQLVYLLRVILYFGVYPCIILISGDYTGFKQKFEVAQKFVIPVTDFLTFFISILLLAIIINEENNRKAEFFEMNKSLPDQSDSRVSLQYA